MVIGFREVLSCTPINEFPWVNVSVGERFALRRISITTFGEV